MIDRGSLRMNCRYSSQCTFFKRANDALSAGESHLRYKKESILVQCFCHGEFPECCERYQIYQSGLSPVDDLLPYDDTDSLFT